MDNRSDVVPGSGLKVVYAEFDVIHEVKWAPAANVPVILCKIHVRRVKVLSRSSMMILIVDGAHTGTGWCFVYCVRGHVDPSASAGAKI